MSTRAAFIDLIKRGWTERDSLLCIGLDPDTNRLATQYRDDGARGVFRFCCDVVDATADLVCAFKPQIAYFAALGLEDELAELIRYVHDRHPDVPVILDAKRGDIGDTARLYAREAFERFEADAVTVNPYLGSESLAPYLAYGDKGVIVLCRTSNPDSAWLQTFPDDANPVYLEVARAAVAWNQSGNVMLVAGATYPEELGRIRAEVGDMPLLVPGVGAQGGDLAAVLAHGADSHGQGLVINASRSVLFADSSDPAQGARRAANAMLHEIRGLQAARNPGRATA